MVPFPAPAHRLPAFVLLLVGAVGLVAAAIFVLGMVDSLGSQPGGASASASPAGTGLTAVTSPTAARSPGPSLAPGATPGVTGAVSTADPSSGPDASPAASPSVKPSASPRPRGGSTAAYVTHGKRNQKWIALTFDADMYPFMYAKRASVPEFDPRIIRLLKQTHTPATIFLNGLYVKAYPDLVRDLARQPNIELANHTWDHAGWVRCTNTTPIPAPLTRTTEVTKVANLVRQVAGVKVRYFRFPGGCYGGGDLDLVKSLGERPIGWDCYFGDSLNWTASQQIASVQSGCRPGSIVITHLNGPPYHSGVYEALKVLLPWWKSHGWEVVNIGTMLNAPTARPAN